MRARYLLTPLATLALAACAGSGAGPQASATPEVPPLQAVADACELPESAVGDEGATLILDGAGKDDRKRVGGELVTVGDKLDMEEIACALSAIPAPDSVISMMEGTRAMDGRQSQEAGGYSYTWTYHPDNGLDVIVTEQE